MTGEIRNPKPEIRINDEIRMTKGGLPRDTHFRISSFGFDSDFWFRHSDFIARHTLGLRSAIESHCVFAARTALLA